MRTCAFRAALRRAARSSVHGKDGRPCLVGLDHALLRAACGMLAGLVGVLVGLGSVMPLSAIVSVAPPSLTAVCKSSRGRAGILVYVAVVLLWASQYKPCALLTDALFVVADPPCMAFAFRDSRLLLCLLRTSRWCTPPRPYLHRSSRMSAHTTWPHLHQNLAVATLATTVARSHSPARARLRTQSPARSHWPTRTRSLAHTRSATAVRCGGHSQYSAQLSAWVPRQHDNPTAYNVQAGR